MSRRGNPYDNAMAEDSFSILKAECIYRHKPQTFQKANNLINKQREFRACAYCRVSIKEDNQIKNAHTSSGFADTTDLSLKDKAEQDKTRL